MLILEQDDTLLSWDNQHLIYYTRAAGCRDTLRYEHRRAATEQLLALPDAIAWCWAKGGDWRRRISPAVTQGAVDFDDRCVVVGCGVCTPQRAPGKSTGFRIT